VSKSFAFSVLFDTSAAFAAFYSYPFLFEKTFSVFLLFLLFSFQTSFSIPKSKLFGNPCIFLQASQAWCLKSSQ